MKKVGLALLIVGAVLMLSAAAFALQPISDNQMAAITAQSGVDIAVDDVVLYTHFENLAYTDNDGVLKDSADAASVELSDFGMTTYINAIAYDASAGSWVSLGGDIGIMGNTTATSYAPSSSFAQPLTIDVGTQPVLSAGYSLVGGSTVAVTGVLIGLPTLEIYVDSLSVTPKVVQNTTPSGATVINSGDDYGTIAITGMTTAILGGHMEIAPH